MVGDSSCCYQGDRESGGCEGVRDLGEEGDQAGGLSQAVASCVGALDYQDVGGAEGGDG